MYVMLELKVFRTGWQEGKVDGHMGAHEQELEFKKMAWNHVSVSPSPASMTFTSCRRS